MSYREELIDSLDAEVFSGDLLETDLDLFSEHVEKWMRAIDGKRHLQECEYCEKIHDDRIACLEYVHKSE